MRSLVSEGRLPTEEQVQVAMLEIKNLRTAYLSIKKLAAKFGNSNIGASHDVSVYEYVEFINKSNLAKLQEQRD